MKLRLNKEQLLERIAIAGIKPGTNWKHIKSESYIIAVGVTLREHDLFPMVIYAEVDTDLLGFSVTFVRPYDEFLSRFKQL